MLSSRSSALTARIALGLAIVSGAARAQPMRTWGAEPEPQPPQQPAQPAPVEPPAPPPTTVGTPADDGVPDALPATPTGVAPPLGLVTSPGHVGLRYSLEGIEVRGNTTTLARVILRYVPFRAGDVLDMEDRELELTRFRLLGTGFFSDVQLSLRKGTRRGWVVLVVTVKEKSTIVLNDLWLGLSADANPNGSARPLTAYGGLDVSETNLAGLGITLGGAFALADRQIALRTRYADPNFLRSAWTLEGSLLYNGARDFFGNRDVLVEDPSQKVAQDYAVVTYRRFGGIVGAGHDLGISTQIFFGYRLERLDARLPFAASHRRGLDTEPIDFQIHDGASVLSTLRAKLTHDTRDEPFLPTRGVYIQLLGDVSLTPLGSDYPYAKLVGSASKWSQLPWGHVLRFEAFVGTVLGEAPLFEKFYVGDFSDLLPHRVLDLNFDRRAAPNFFGTTIGEIRYGQHAAKLNTEYRIPLYRGHRSIYGVDVFGSVGLYGVADNRDFTQHARGYTGLATVPFDLTFNLGLKVDTSAGGLTIGLSNLLGFIPVREGAQ
jgi:outer membrane protein assembly factor BamA